MELPPPPRLRGVQTATASRPLAIALQHRRLPWGRCTCVCGLLHARRQRRCRGPRAESGACTPEGLTPTRGRRRRRPRAEVRHARETPLPTLGVASAAFTTGSSARPPPPRPPRSMTVNSAAGGDLPRVRAPRQTRHRPREEEPDQHGSAEKTLDIVACDTHTRFPAPHTPAGPPHAASTLLGTAGPVCSAGR